MELLGTFETFSELAVALAGFSGIVTVLSDRESTPQGAADWFRLKALLVWSLGVAFLALVLLTEIAVAAGYFAQFGAVLYLVAFVWFLFMAAVTFSLLLFVHES